MEVRIGIIQSPRELTFETDATATEIREQIESAVSEGRALLSFSDTKEKQILVPTSALAYVEFGGDTGRKVGFVS